MMAGRGKLSQTKKERSPAREAIPLRAPFDEFKVSPSTSSRRRSDTVLLPGLPDKTPRRKKDNSPLPKDPNSKEGALQAPGLGSLIEKCVDERHKDMHHFGEPPLKEHRELPSEENQDKSISSSSTQLVQKAQILLIRAFQAKALKLAQKP